MPDEYLKVIREEVSNAVAVTVNGKIDKIHGILERQNEVMDTLVTKVDKHIDRVTPYIEGFEGITKTGKVTIFIGGVVTAITASLFFLKQLLK